jgi:hypothetical protein
MILFGGAVFFSDLTRVSSAFHAKAEEIDLHSHVKISRYHFTYHVQFCAGTAQESISYAPSVWFHAGQENERPSIGLF